MGSYKILKEVAISIKKTELSMKDYVTKWMEKHEAEPLSKKQLIAVVLLVCEFVIKGGDSDENN